ncbi:MAG: radical SAM protein, partial [Candidatus Aminicenantes bacterium]|nr:radical SAM protein [Candidatus Aminicenantes bacterium]NIT26384.1 radical SAM protein [Candidatus Aminicenantes bacterium]
QNGVTKIRITGGEPLVRKGIAGFLDSVSQIPGLHDLGLTTNGILLKEFSEKLYRAGLQRVNVSMDSLDKDKYAYITGGGSLE